MTQTSNSFLEETNNINEPLLPVKKRRKLSSFGHAKERSEILESLSMLLASGMDIGSIFKTLSKEAHTKYTQKILSGISEDIEAGDPLWKALENSGLFPSQTISFIKLGEESGRLPETMTLVVEQIEKQRLFSSQIRSALLYPVVVLGVSGIVGIGITWFIIPRLAITFGQLHLKLPLLTRIIVNLGNFLLHYGAIAVPALIIGVILIGYLLFGYKKTKSAGQWIIFHLPVFQTLIREVELARFGYTLGSLITAGMPIVEALDSLKRGTDFKMYAKFYDYLHTATLEGESFQNSLSGYSKSHKLFPPAVQDMIINAEQSGKLAETFTRIGKTYEGRIETTSKNLTILLEPILLVIVWLVVLFIALAIIMPIYSIFDGLQQGSNPTPPPPVASTIVPAESVDPAKPNPDDTQTVKAPDSTAQTTPTPTNTPTISPSPTPNTSSSATSQRELTITETPTGYLNVRTEPSRTGNLLTRVYPKETYNYVEYKTGWYKITLKDGETGWISEQYVSTSAVPNQTSP